MSSVTPRVDIAFKKIFGVEENKDLLISLINSIVSQEDQVADVELLNPYNVQNFKNDKLSILDIKARDLNGQYYNIEMQISDEADYDKRALYYWAKTYTEQLVQSVNYSQLKKTIGIHILNFISVTDTDKYHNVFYLTEQTEGFRYFKDIELHTVELVKFEKEATGELLSFVSKVQTSLDAWVTYLTKHDMLSEDNLPKELNNPQIKKALHVLNIMNLTREEREEYEAHLKWLRAEASALRKQDDKGYERGIEQGILKVARNLLNQGIEVNSISKATGLSKSEIEKLR